MIPNIKERKSGHCNLLQIRCFKSEKLHILDGLQKVPDILKILNCRVCRSLCTLNRKPTILHHLFQSNAQNNGSENACKYDSTKVKGKKRRIQKCATSPPKKAEILSLHYLNSLSCYKSERHANEINRSIQIMLSYYNKICLILLSETIFIH